MIVLKKLEKSHYPFMQEMLLALDSLHNKALPDQFLVPTPITQTQYNEWLENSAQFLCGAFDGETLAGFAKARFFERQANRVQHAQHIAKLEELFVKFEFQHLGIGKQLVLATENWAKHLGAKQLEASVSSFNSSAQQFYQNIGLLPLHGTLIKPIG